MTVETIMAELKAKGSENTKKILLKHGMKEPLFGVLVKDLKEIQKKVKVDYELAKGLYATGNADAMYLAGLIADDKKMTKKDLTQWVNNAVSSNINFYTVPWVTAEGNFGFEIATEWINDKRDHVAAAGWATLANLAALKPDELLDIAAFKKLLQRAVKEIDKAESKVSAGMKSFIVSTGCYVMPLSEYALEMLKSKNDKVKDVNGCIGTDTIDVINKAIKRGTLGKKKKTVKC